MSGDIKNLKPTFGKFKQGYYNPKNPEKYIGDLSKVIFRSSWELKFMQYCDNFSSILKWSSEPIPIPYYNPMDDKMHKYNVDFYIRYLKDESEKEYLVEIKPNVDKTKPTPPKTKTKKAILDYNRKLKIFITNSVKFEAATIFAQNRGMEFLVLTQDFLFQNNLK